MFHPRFQYAISRLIGQGTELVYEREAVQRRELAPARPGVRPAGILLPGQLDRARAAMPSTTMEFQKSVATGGPITYPATTLYTLKDARIEQTAIYANGKRKSLTGIGIQQEMTYSRGQSERKIDRALLVSTHQGLKYFGDWLFENTARVLLAEELGERAISMVRMPPYTHGARYDELFAVHYQKIRRARVKELLVVDDWGHTPEKAARYRTLRERARCTPGRAHGHDVFVVRGRSGQVRRLANEDACIEWARQRGFSIVDPVQMTVNQLVHELRDARCVAGVEGSGLMHGLVAMASDGFLLGIVAADRFVIGSKEYADALGIPVALVVADKGNLDGFEVDIEELNATYELALASA